MRLLHLLSLSLLLALQAACAQPADEFFHSGAQSYLTNNIAKAREEVDNGLKLYPEDIKLKKLDELLKQQSQQQQSKNDQQKQDQDKKDQQQKQQQKQDQQGQKQQQQPNQGQKDQQDQQAKSSGEKKDKPDERQGEQSGSTQAQSMTPQEAKQLLDAQKGDETLLQLKPEGKPEKREHPIKDW